jgi:hypothetical protein
MNATPLVLKIKIRKNFPKEFNYPSMFPEKGVDLNKKMAELEHLVFCCQKWNDG